MGGLELFGLLLVGHYLCDYPLQGDYLARAKNRHDPLGKGWVWLHALTGHAIIHGGAVAIITGNPLLGFAEAVVHWSTDKAKCEGKISYHTDQAIHIFCKALWAYFAVSP